MGKTKEQIDIHCGGYLESVIGLLKAPKAKSPMPTCQSLQC